MESIIFLDRLSGFFFIISILLIFLGSVAQWLINYSKFIQIFKKEYPQWIWLIRIPFGRTAFFWGTIIYKKNYLTYIYLLFPYLFIIIFLVLAFFNPIYYLCIIAYDCIYVTGMLAIRGVVFFRYDLDEFSPSINLVMQSGLFLFIIAVFFQFFII